MAPPSNRRCSLLFGCVGTVWHRVGGGVKPPAPIARLSLLPRPLGSPRMLKSDGDFFTLLLTNYPTFCQQFRALPSWLKRDGVFFILQTERQIFLQHAANKKSEGKQHLGFFVDKRWGNLSTTAPVSGHLCFQKLRKLVNNCASGCTKPQGKPMKNDSTERPG